MSDSVGEPPAARGGEPTRRALGRAAGHAISVTMVLLHLTLAWTAALVAESGSAALVGALVVTAGSALTGLIAVASSLVVERRAVLGPWLLLALPIPAYVVLGLVGVVPLP